MQVHDTKWQNYLHSIGYPNVAPLASGMEGAVYDLGDDKVAKVWASQSSSRLNLLRRLYSKVAEYELQFRTPEIIDVIETRGTCITIERKLHGTPLRRNVSGNEAELSSDEVSCFITTLRGLTKVPASKTIKSLTVLDEDTPAWSNQNTWREAIASLVERRAKQYGSQLQQAVTAFDEKLLWITASLKMIHDTDLTLIHGDLTPANVLVDHHTRPIAVLDFGFLTMAGDSAFDAAIATAIFNMYGLHSASIERQLTQAVIDTFGYSPDRLALYKAAYAVITSNAYDPTGKDGHFEWCVNRLNMLG